MSTNRIMRIDFNNSEINKFDLFVLKNITLFTIVKSISLNDKYIN